MMDGEFKNSRHHVIKTKHGSKRPLVSGLQEALEIAKDRSQAYDNAGTLIKPISSAFSFIAFFCRFVLFFS